MVNVPDRSDARVFVLGEVTKPQTVQIARAGLTLADALASVNSIDVRAADPRQIYVIRGAADAIRLRFKVTADGGEIAVNGRTDVLIQPRLTILRAEDHVNEDLAEGLGHADML